VRDLRPHPGQSAFSDDASCLVGADGTLGVASAVSTGIPLIINPTFRSCDLRPRRRKTGEKNAKTQQIASAKLKNDDRACH
jgi:hypothetical protein